jgi:hypothetical protein
MGKFALFSALLLLLAAALSATLARLSFWVLPERRAEFEAACDHQVAPPRMLGILQTSL